MRGRGLCTASRLHPYENYGNPSPVSRARPVTVGYIYGYNPANIDSKCFKEEEVENATGVCSDLT